MHEAPLLLLLLTVTVKPRRRHCSPPDSHIIGKVKGAALIDGRRVVGRLSLHPVYLGCAPVRARLRIHHLPNMFTLSTKL